MSAHSAVQVSGLFAAPGELAQLKRSAQAQHPEALREAARQFESVFARMLLSSMRAASFGDALMGSDQQEFYQGLFDDQLAVELTRGDGLGLADLLVQQLTRAGLPSTAGGSTSLPAPAATPATSSTAATWRPATREDFVRELWPHAQAAGRELGVEPRTLLSHAALESGWGRAMPCDADGRCSFNLFGVKPGAQWDGPTVTARTLEFENGVPASRTERFRAYDSAAAGFRDYVGLLRGSPRYAAALGTGGDVHAFASALQQAGYATDPGYARKLEAVARSLDALTAGSGFKSADARPITGGGRTI